MLEKNKTFCDDEWVIPGLPTYGRRIRVLFNYVYVKVYKYN